MLHFVSFIHPFIHSSLVACFPAPWGQEILNDWLTTVNPALRPVSGTINVCQMIESLQRMRLSHSDILLSKGRHYCPHFLDEEIKAQKGFIWSHTAGKVAKLKLLFPIQDSLQQQVYTCHSLRTTLLESHPHPHPKVLQVDFQAIIDKCRGS